MLPAKRIDPALARRSWLHASLMLVAAILALQGCAPPSGYELIVLPPLPGHFGSEAYGVNAANPPWAVGASIDSDGQPQPVMWQVAADGSVTTVPLQNLPGGLAGIARDVNASAESVGFSTLYAPENHHGALWQSGLASDIFLLADEYIGNTLVAEGIADNGIIVGSYSFSLGLGQKAFVFANGNLRSFDEWPGAPGSRSWLYAIDTLDAGVVAAGSFEPGGSAEIHALLAHEAGFIDLGTLGGGFSEAFGVEMFNDAEGDVAVAVVGTSSLTSGGAEALQDSHAVLWTLNASDGMSGNVQMRDLGTLEPSVGARAMDVNATLEVVGFSGQRAFRWTESNGLEDLNTLVPATVAAELMVASAINGRGEIVGTGNVNFDKRGYLLRPLPVAEVEMVKTGPGVVASGAVLTYTLTVTNLTGQSQTVTIEDPIPAGTSYEAALNTANWQVTGGVASLSVNVPATSQQQVDLALRVNAVAGAQISNVNHSIAWGGNVPVISTVPVTTVVTAVTGEDPMVELVQPVGCNGLSPGSDMVIEVTASDPDGTVTQVDFYVGSTLLGSATAAPFAFTWTNVPAGIHCVHAVATDNSGAMAQSQSACVAVGLGQGPFTAYTITELPTLGGDHGAARGLNNAGVVVGSSRLPANPEAHPVRWVNGAVHQLTPTPGSAVAINESGAIAGTLLANPATAFVWENGQLTPLGDYQGNYTTAADINDAGQVAALYSIAAQTGGASFRCIVWQGGSITDIGVVEDPSVSNRTAHCTAINNAGQVAGAAGHVEIPFNYHEPFLWTPGGSGGVPSNPAMQSLGTLGGQSGLARSLNDAAVVVGSARLAGFSLHAFLWADGATTGVPSNPEMEDLHNSGFSSSAHDINDAGLVVGRFSTANPIVRHAFLYSCGQVLDLNDLIAPGSGWLLESAEAINEVGQIAGDGVLNGEARGFLLTPNY